MCGILNCAIQSADNSSYYSGQLRNCRELVPVTGTQRDNEPKLLMGHVSKHVCETHVASPASAADYLLAEIIL